MAEEQVAETPASDEKALTMEPVASVDETAEEEVRETPGVDNTMSFVVGQKVLAQWSGNADWYGGVIEACHQDDGTYDVLFDDGDREEHKDSAQIMEAPESVENEE